MNQKTEEIELKKPMCYGYDKELRICLIYGCACNSMYDNLCYHQSKEEIGGK